MELTSLLPSLYFLSWKRLKWHTSLFLLWVVREKQSDLAGTVLTWSPWWRYSLCNKDERAWGPEVHVYENGGRFLSTWTSLQSTLPNHRKHCLSTLDHLLSILSNQMNTLSSIRAASRRTYTAGRPWYQSLSRMWLIDVGISNEYGLSKLWERLWTRSSNDLNCLVPSPQTSQKHTHWVQNQLLAYSYFFCCCDKNMLIKQIKEGRNHFCSQFAVTIHHCRVAMVTGVFGHWSHLVWSQEAELNECLYSAVLSFYTAGDPDSRVVFTSINLI